MNENNTQPCCPKFDPVPWDKKMLHWDNKLFIKGSIPQFMHFPLPGTIAKLMTKLHEQATGAGAAPDVKDFLCLAYDPSPWKCEYYYAVTKEVPGADNIKISGDFFTQVFDGPYSSIPSWIQEINSAVAEQQKQVVKYYFYYTTCPKCAKIYGHNYVVAVTEVK